MNLRSAAALFLLGLGLSVTAQANGAKPTVHVGSYRVERDVTPGRNKVVGTLTNTGRAPVHSAKVSFRLYDAKGRVVGRASDEVHDLRPGHTWKFHAHARGNVSRARLLHVEAK
ncbi:FxLYD domain-containing protein [Dyella telluris]|uniref:Uncharacterized protein n=1 Tax=Dyella telluris TaxID=2763498 RepID=A0A7G8Q1Q1_9GAMM|nr:FxLYD domain-containing protein [Dyella telluris]QNK00709.1 hypothetical protein H8F01_16695 [Dyella telluris]